MTTTTSSVTDPYAAVNAASAGSSSTSTSTPGSADAFLKMLTTQLQNQDPLNPMDNAQITSQMAQINTVSGIQTLNTTVQSLNTQFVQMQALQGAALVGHDVTIAGNKLAVENGEGVGAFDLSATADSVKVEVLDASGRVADTMQLGALEAGRHDISWSAPSGVTSDSGYTFRVTAKSGTAAVPTTALMRDQVEAVSSGSDGLSLELAHSGSVLYTAVKAFN